MACATGAPRMSRSWRSTFQRWERWCRTGRPVRPFRRCRPRQLCSPRRYYGLCAGCPPNAAPSLCWRTCIWADRETLAMPDYLADHVAAFRVAVVLTARSDEPGTSGLSSAVSRDPMHLHLAPLADSEVATMAAACLGLDNAPEAILAGLRRNAGGLPLLVEDLIGVAGHPDPMRYAEIIPGRLAGLDAGARGLVEAVAILGTEVDAGLLGQVSGLPPKALADAVTAARVSGLLMPVDGRLAFRHALVRELVLAQLDPRGRAGLCCRAAETLEAPAAPRRVQVGQLDRIETQRVLLGLDETAVGQQPLPMVHYGSAGTTNAAARAGSIPKSQRRMPTTSATNLGPKNCLPRDRKCAPACHADRRLAGHGLQPRQQSVPDPSPPQCAPIAHGRRTAWTASDSQESS
jgi:hypothetical protein